MKFFVCAHCGNLITYLHASGVQAVCCGDKMQELTPNTVDAAREKHLPVLSASGETVTVKVGAVEHPMAEEHHIEWIILETKQGYQKKDLKPGEKPEAAFRGVILPGIPRIKKRGAEKSASRFFS
jgi:superoxide reductase